jgi:hypothetical protein
MLNQSVNQSQTPEIVIATVATIVCIFQCQYSATEIMPVDNEPTATQKSDAFEDDHSWDRGRILHQYRMHICNLDDQNPEQ